MMDRAACLAGVRLAYRRAVALDGVDLEIPAGCLAGVVGPDGVGKSSLLALIAGARAIREGQVEVLGGDMRRAAHRRETRPRIAYMPQGLGRNLYGSLSVAENIDFFARLFGLGAAERERRIDLLTRATGLAEFTERPAAKLSGGMQQKLGLCCALVHNPDLLVLDEPTTGVDPLSRRQFWDLVGHVRAARPGMSVLVATATFEEAERFDWLAMLDAGRLLATGPPDALRERTGADSLEAAFIALLPAARRKAHVPVDRGERAREPQAEAVIEARALTRRFGDFTAVDQASFSIGRGEIFGFVGSNGCGKTTTMKMLTGLLEPSEGEARLFGEQVDPRDLATRRRVGYMAQFFSLYRELSVRRNLALHAGLYGIQGDAARARIAELAERFDLQDHLDDLPKALPLGHRQRLSLAAAVIHRPSVLILDEPTSGVDPVARDAFWQILARLSRDDGVTLFISTHFMNEAARCDRVALMHAGRVLAVDAPAALVKASGAADLEAAFVARLRREQDDAGSTAALDEVSAQGRRDERADSADSAGNAGNAGRAPRVRFDLRRLLAHARRERLELQRDPLRLAMALIGSVILLFVMSYGISLDVDDLTFAVLDRDRTTLSRDYTGDIAGSRYFVERPPITSEDALEARMRAGELGLAIEIPPGFAADIARGRSARVGAWIDGSMPQRAETIRGYVQGMHAHWLARKAREAGHEAALITPYRLETRFRYNPDLESLVAMVPAVIPLLLMLIPAMLTALSVVREKELGSITNFHVTPTTRLEFLVGKQLPYIVLSMGSFLLLVLMALSVFDIALKGSFATLSAGALVYLAAATAVGLVISTFMRSQIAAIFGTAVLSIIPAVSFSGMIEPVSSLEGLGRLIGEVYPTTHFLMIARGAFAKGLGFEALQGAFVPLLIAVPVLLGLAVLLLAKQER